MMPAASHRSSQQLLDEPGTIGLVPLGTPGAGETGFIAADKRLDDPRRDEPGQIRTSRRGGKGERQADNVGRRIADYGLIEIADLDFPPALGVRQRAEIAEMTIAADPDRRSFGYPP